jgi:hypothetical protein
MDGGVRRLGILTFINALFENEDSLLVYWGVNIIYVAYNITADITKYKTSSTASQLGVGRTVIYYCLVIAISVKNGTQKA